jgi:nucleoside-diphosphate-sugar epimerase
MAAERSAFVTGGSGFIGGRLISRLRADGWGVRALARSPVSEAKVAELGAEPVAGDLSDRAAIEAGARGCERAFHLAAQVGQWGPREDFVRGNVTGTENVLAACRAAGVSCFVHCSSEAALLGGDPLIHADESAPLRPDSPAPYASTKAIAEQRVFAANSEGFETVVMRPRFVWGKGDTTLLPEIIEAAESGLPIWVGGGHHITDVTHVDNVVEGLVLCGERGHPGEAYFVTDDAPIAFREFITDLLETQGIEPSSRSAPKWVARALAATGQAAWRVLPLRGQPPLTTFGYWISTQECTLEIGKARRELGYAPVKSLAQGLAELRAGG